VLGALCLVVSVTTGLGSAVAVEQRPKTPSAPAPSVTLVSNETVSADPVPAEPLPDTSSATDAGAGGTSATFTILPR